MAAALLLLVVLDGADLAALTDPARAVRERAVAELARHGPPTRELAKALLDDDARLAAGVAAVLERREDPEALPPLLRCAAGERTECGRAAARAAVRIAFAAGEPLTAASPPRLARRLEEAVHAEVLARLEPLQGGRADDRPQLYRPLFAGEWYSAAALRRILLDDRASPLVRTHAAAAYFRLAGPDAAPLFGELLSSAEPYVRWAAAAYLARLDHRPGLESLARMLERPGARQPLLAHAAVAARRTGVLGDVAVRRLEQFVRGSDMELAVAAASALAAHRPEAAERAVRARVRSFLRSDAHQPGAGAYAARFLVAGLPVGEEERALCRASPDPLLSGAAEPDPARALEILRPVIAPERPAGLREALRVQVVGALLVRHDAPPADRIAFARLALGSDVAQLRAGGIRVLRDVPGVARARLEPRLLLALQDVSEQVRVGAAELLAPAPGALEVLAWALYDGDPYHARTAARLVPHGSGWPAVDPDALPAERRRVARALLDRIEALRRDKD